MHIKLRTHTEKQPREEYYEDLPEEFEYFDVHGRKRWVKSSKADFMNLPFDESEKNQWPKRSVGSEGVEFTEEQETDLLEMMRESEGDDTQYEVRHPQKAGDTMTVFKLAKIAPQKYTFSTAGCAIVGNIKYKSIHISIAPKQEIKIRSLQKVYFGALGIPDVSDIVEGCEGENDHHESLLLCLLHLFAHELKLSLLAPGGHGILRGYKRIRRQSSTVKGRILFSEHLRRHGEHWVPTMECEYRIFSADTRENRLMAAAVRYAAMVCTKLRSDSFANGLDRIECVLHDSLRLFSKVKIQHYTQEDLAHWEMPAFTEVNAAYEGAIRLSHCILLEASRSFGIEAGKSVHFLRHFPFLFESYVRNELNRLNLTRESPFAPQNGSDDAAFVKRTIKTLKRVNPPAEFCSGIVPDLYHHDVNSGKIIVGDVRNRFVPQDDSSEQIYREDLFQMVTYMVMANARYGFFVHSGSLSSCDETEGLLMKTFEMRVHNGDGIFTIDVFILNLNSASNMDNQFMEILSQLDNRLLAL
eukprot:g295.t1